MNKDEVFLPLSPDTTMFDVVGFAQTHFKGHHFCALKLCLERFGLVLRPVPYEPLADADVPDFIELNGMLTIKRFGVFEHVLQCVRYLKPGKSFQEVFYIDFEMQ